MRKKIVRQWVRKKEKIDEKEREKMEDKKGI
jgi:hypothetical protein